MGSKLRYVQINACTGTSMRHSKLTQRYDQRQGADSDLLLLKTHQAQGQASQAHLVETGRLKRQPWQGAISQLPSHAAFSNPLRESAFHGREYRGGMVCHLDGRCERQRLRSRREQGQQTALVQVRRTKNYHYQVKHSRSSNNKEARCLRTWRTSTTCNPARAIE